MKVNNVFTYFEQKILFFAKKISFNCKSKKTERHFFAKVLHIEFWVKINSNRYSESAGTEPNVRTSVKDVKKELMIHDEKKFMFTESSKPIQMNYLYSLLCSLANQHQCRQINAWWSNNCTLCLLFNQWKNEMKERKKGKHVRQWKKKQMKMQ